MPRMCVTSSSVDVSVAASVVVSARVVNSSGVGGVVSVPLAVTVSATSGAPVVAGASVVVVVVDVVDVGVADKRMISLATSVFFSGLLALIREFLAEAMFCDSAVSKSSATAGRFLMRMRLLRGAPLVACRQKPHSCYRAWTIIVCGPPHSLLATMASV